jgi:hypothetical protein
VYKIFESIEFKHRKTNDGHKFLMERGNTVAAETVFLGTVYKLRISHEHPVFYLDETWGNHNYSRKCIWQDLSRKRGLKVPSGNGSRWIFHSCAQVKDSNYHSERNTDSSKD